MWAAGRAHERDSRWKGATAMRVDCQTHVFPRAYAELLLQNTTSVCTVKNGDAYLVSSGDLQTFALSLDTYDPDAKVRDMDAAGIDVSVLSVNELVGDVASQLSLRTLQTQPLLSDRANPRGPTPPWFSAGPTGRSIPRWGPAGWAGGTAPNPSSGQSMPIGPRDHAGDPPPPLRQAI
jgi:hypothetical protein